MQLSVIMDDMTNTKCGGQGFTLKRVTLAGTAKSLGAFTDGQIVAE